MTGKGAGELVLKLYLHSRLTVFTYVLTHMCLGGKNTQKNYTKKDLYDPDNHNGVITQLEPDILECEVKWALRSITMSM